MADEIRFGNAYGEFCNIEPESPRTEVVFKKRPDQHGEDAFCFGKRGDVFTGQVELFGLTRAAIDNEKRKWEAEQGQVHTLYMTSGGARGQWINVICTLARPLMRAHLITAATNGMNWMMSMTINMKQLEV